MTFEEQVKAKVKWIRDQLTHDETINKLYFHINVEGRTDGDFKISYEIGINYQNNVQGNSIDAVLTEAKRRYGWNQTNAPREISFIPELKKAKDEIPF